MSRTYHTRKAFRQKVDQIRQSLERQSAESGVTTLAAGNQLDNAYLKAKEHHTRHPSGTKATGLRQWLKGKWRVANDRNRLNNTEFQSSRLRKERRAGKHFARLKNKKELRTQMNDLDNE